MANHQRDPLKERFWRRMLQRWQRTNLTIRDFCSQQQLSEASFYAWRRIIAERDRPAPAGPVTTTPPTHAQRHSPPPLPAFVPVRVVPTISPSATIEVVLGNRRLLRVPPGFDPTTLRQLLALLEEPSC